MWPRLRYYLLLKVMAELDKTHVSQRGVDFLICCRISDSPSVSLRLHMLHTETHAAGGWFYILGTNTNRDMLNNVRLKFVLKTNQAAHLSPSLLTITGPTLNLFHLFSASIRCLCFNDTKQNLHSCSKSFCDYRQVCVIIQYSSPAAQTTASKMTNTVESTPL